MSLIELPKPKWKVWHWKLEYLKLFSKRDRVLDLGCGEDAVYSPYLGREVVTCDIQKVKGVDVVCDIHALPFRNGIFDLVWCSEVLEHVDEQEEAVEEVLRVGNSVIFFFAMPSPSFHSDPEHRPVLVDFKKYNPELTYDKWAIPGFPNHPANNLTRVVCLKIRG